MIFYLYTPRSFCEVMIRLLLILLAAGPIRASPNYFGHLDPDINCVFHAIGRYIRLGGVRGFFISVGLSVLGCGTFC